MFDFDELAAFSSVMATGSVTQSARRMGLAKSTLSRRISQLEARLNQPLLRRQSNRLIPTEAGLLFHQYCEELLSLANQSREALAELREEISGQLTLEVHGALARAWAAQVVEAFLARHPRVELTLRTQETPPSRLDSHSVHVWLGAFEGSTLNQEPLGELERGLYANPRYLARAPALERPGDLHRHAWIDLLDSAASGVALTHAQAPEVLFTPPRSRLRVDQTLLHLDAIASGQGIGLLPHWLVARREAHHPGDLVHCLPGWAPAPLPVSLLYPFGRQPRRMGALLAFLREQTPRAWQAR